MKAAKSVFTLLICVTVVRILEMGKTDGVCCNSECLGSHRPLPEASRVTLSESYPRWLSSHIQLTEI